MVMLIFTPIEMPEQPEKVRAGSKWDTSAFRSRGRLASACRNDDNDNEDGDDDDEMGLKYSPDHGHEHEQMNREMVEATMVDTTLVLLWISCESTIMAWIWTVDYVWTWTFGWKAS